MRTRYKPWIKDALKELYENILVEHPINYKGTWKEYFGNINPIHLELGMGKGQFISTLAKNNPEKNYIGIEVQEGVVYYPAKKLSEEGYQNIAILQEDVKNLKEFFGPQEIQEIYINFCDPWPKKRHAKRRLTHTNFLNIYKDILKPGGKIKFKTDNKDLFAFSLEEIEQAGCDIINVSWDLHKDEAVNSRNYGKDFALTEYEQKFMARGIPICYCEAGI